MARDLARTDLSRAEQETLAARSAREQEKKRLQGLAEERRRHYEAMEKRLRLASVGEDKEESGRQTWVRVLTGRPGTAGGPDAAAGRL